MFQSYIKRQVTIFAESRRDITSMKYAPLKKIVELILWYKTVADETAVLAV